MRRGNVLLVIVVLLLTAVAYAQLSGKGSAAGGGYRVTPWPTHAGPEESFAKEVEDHLNKLNADGWRFHSELVGPFGKLMIFERSGNR